MSQTAEEVLKPTELRRLVVAEEEHALHKPSGDRSAALRRNWSRWILLFALLAALTAGTFWWLHSRNFESTDDAQIDGHVDLVSTRISGTVAYINPRVENNQFVTAGTLLLELDPRDY